MHYHIADPPLLAIHMRCFAVRDRGGEAEIHTDTNIEVCNNWLLLIIKNNFLSGLHEDARTNFQKHPWAATARRVSPLRCRGRTIYLLINTCICSITQRSPAFAIYIDPQRSPGH